MNDVDPQKPTDDDTGEFEPVTTGNEPEDSYADLRPCSQDDWLRGMSSWLFDHAGFTLICLAIFFGPRLYGAEPVIKGPAVAFAQDGQIRVEKDLGVVLVVLDPRHKPPAIVGIPYRLLFRDRERYKEAAKWDGKVVTVYGHLGCDDSMDFVIVNWMQERKKE